MLIKVSTDKTVREAATVLEVAVQANHFSVMQVHNLKESMAKKGGKTILATLKPTTLLAMFNAPPLAGVAQEVEDTIVKIMKDAASA
ncbi:MAG: hypothetical protein NTY00_01045 [Deltaproteobacteria bacterium]|nr:hypothetical protein [Deltaproteobacteria bacterium]